MALPVVNQPTHRSGALLDHLASRMRLWAEAGDEQLAKAERALAEVDKAHEPA